MCVSQSYLANKRAGETCVGILVRFARPLHLDDAENMWRSWYEGKSAASDARVALVHGDVELPELEAVVGGVEEVRAAREPQLLHEACQGRVFWRILFRFFAGFRPPFPPAVGSRLLLIALAAAIA